jgi:predicted nucleotidyltransferase
MIGRLRRSAVSSSQVDAEVVWTQPPPLSRAQLVTELRGRLPAKVREAYLFGSYAREEASADSDFDLIIVAESMRSFPDRFRDFADLGEGLPPMDLLVYTPAEWRGLRARPSPLLRMAMAEWVALRN